MLSGRTKSHSYLPHTFITTRTIKRARTPNVHVAMTLKGAGRTERGTRVGGWVRGWMGMNGEGGGARLGAVRQLIDSCSYGENTELAQLLLRQKQNGPTHRRMHGGGGGKGGSGGRGGGAGGKSGNSSPGRAS
jgi:hypothetical protein